MPINYTLSDSEIETLLSKLNGVVLPNGDAEIFTNGELSEFSLKAKVVYEYAKE